MADVPHGAREAAADPELCVVTERLRLRPLAARDLERLVELDADPEVRRYLDQPRAPSRAEVQARLPRWLQRCGAHGEPAFWAAEARGSGAFLGWFHLRPTPDGASLELGYRLRAAYWGRGLATEGARALVGRAFQVLGAERVVAHALEANRASRRVLEKAGLREQRAYLHDGRLPAVAYALERLEWAAHADGSASGDAGPAGA